MQGIPPIPVDGDQYSGPFAGVPAVLEYDAPTGGYKLVVVNETGVALNISGTVQVTSGEITLVGGSQYGEDTVHLSGGTGTFVMGIRHDALTSTVDADGDYAGLHLNNYGLLKTVISSPAGVANTNDANPTGVYTISHLKAFADASGLYARLMGRAASADNIDNDEFGFNLNTNSLVFALNASGNMDRIRGTSQTGLNVSMISGSFPNDVVVAIADNMVNAAKALPVAGFNYTYDGTNWDRVRTLTLEDDQQSPGANFTVSAAVLSYRPLDDSWARLYSRQPNSDAIPVTDFAISVQSYNLMYDVVGANWERDAARVYTNTMASPVAPQRIAFGMHFDYALGTNHPNYGMRPDTDGIQGDSGGGGFEHGQNVNAIMYGRSSTQGFDRLVGTKERGLNVSLISGSFPGQAASIEINDAIAGALRAGIVGSAGLMYDVAGGNWERIPARSNANDGIAAGVFPQTIGMNYFFNYADASWARLRGGNPGQDGEGATNDSDYSDAINTKSIPYGLNPAGTFDRIRGSKESGLYVSMISGSFPDGAEALPADAATPLKALQTTSYLMGYNGVTYDRLYMGQSGSLAVDLISQLDAVNDEVTAYVTGSVSVTGQTFDTESRLNVSAFVTGTVSQRSISNNPLDGGGPSLFYPLEMNGTAIMYSPSTLFGYDPVADDWNRVRLDASTGALLVAITGTASVDTELPAAVAAADGLANPTAPSVLSHLMGYNGATYDRLYMGVSGSLLVDLVTGLDPVNDEVTAYITGTTSLNLGGKTVVRAVLNISGIALDQIELVAAVGGEKIKVIEAMIIGNADVSIFFQSGFTGTALTGPMSLPSDGDGFFVGTPAQIEAHHFETIAGENLVLDLDANVLLGGWINYYTEA